jgi:hypothetical protein
MMITSKFNAKRFAGKPLRQPLYQFQSVESCKKDLEGSTLYEVQSREDFVDATAEMVLLCNEAMRRSKRPTGKSMSKPLSLEYIADRLVSKEFHRKTVCYPSFLLTKVIL